MRYAVISELLKQAKKNKNIMLLTADLGYTLIDEFAAALPKQFVNVGVAEANMMGMAAGLALSGKIVFVYSICTFATLRAYESIRNDICLQKVHVVIMGSGSGLSYSEAGPSHHSTGDIAVMRVLPNLNIFSPADPIEAKWTVEKAITLKKPAYLRLGKHGEPHLYKKKPNLKFGKGSILKGGNDFVIFSTGRVTNNAMLAAENLDKKGIKGSVVSLHTLKPIDEELISCLSQKTKNIFAVEEHHEIGGLGSIVSNVLTKNNIKFKKFIKVGLPDEFITKSGSQQWLHNKYGICPSGIEKIITKNLK